MASSAEKEKKIVLRSWDGEEFEVEEAKVRQSELIGNIIEDGCTENTIPLFNVDVRILAKVIEYCKKHSEATNAPGDDNNADEKIKSWDTEYIEVDQAILCALLQAANYLDIKGLLDLVCNRVADMTRGKSAEEIRKTFNIKNDFTPEEEEEVRKQNQWAFE